MSSKPTTFQDLSECLETAISSAFRESSKVVLVPDRYDIALSSLEIKIHSGNQKLPKDVHCYLSNPQNKVNLINYVFQSTFQSKLQNNQILVLTHLDVLPKKSLAKHLQNSTGQQTTSRQTAKCLSFASI
jgi:hypothetical protein